jgi:hypothetical protein
MKSIGLVTIALALSTGCAASPAMKAQVAELEQRSYQQDRQIAELEGHLAAAKAEHVTGNLSQAGSDAIDAATSAWNWASAQVSSSYKATETAAHKCYSDNVKLQSFDDYKALAIKCWNQE